MRTARLGLAASFLLLALPVQADAPIGTDAQYRSFVAGDPVIVDRFTKLSWTRSVPLKQTFDAATGLCAAPRRLPTMKELLTLVDEQPNDVYDQQLGQALRIMIDRRAFWGDGARTPTDAPYWTSSVSVNPSDQVFTVSFASGTTSTSPKSASNYVRCVEDVP